MADKLSPWVRRRRLRNQLRQARQEASLSYQQAASELGWSLSKMNRIESGSYGISVDEINALLRLYQITDPAQTEELVALAQANRKRPWWSAYHDVAPPGLLHLIEHESAASVIKQFEATFIPRILQTEDYAQAVLEAYYSEESSPLGTARVLAELLVKHGDLLDQEDPPNFSLILDEAAIRRLVGGPAVMYRQVRRLIEVAKKPNVTIQIVPFAAGLHPGMWGAFEIMEFSDSPDVVFLESARDNAFEDDPGETRRYRKMFEQLAKTAMEQRDSLAYLDEITPNQ